MPEILNTIVLELDTAVLDPEYVIGGEAPVTNADLVEKHDESWGERRSYKVIAGIHVVNVWLNRGDPVDDKARLEACVEAAMAAPVTEL